MKKFDMSVDEEIYVNYLLRLLSKKARLVSVTVHAGVIEMTARVYGDGPFRVSEDGFILFTRLVEVEARHSYYDVKIRIQRKESRDALSIPWFRERAVEMGLIPRIDDTRPICPNCGERHTSPLSFDMCDYQAMIAEEFTDETEDND